MDRRRGGTRKVSESRFESCPIQCWNDWPRNERYAMRVKVSDPVPAELVDCDASRKYSIDAFHSLAKSCKASERQRQIAAMPSPPTDDCATVVLSDDKIVELACNKPKTGEKFQSLWNGDWNDHFNSASEADSSVVFSLAYYTKDAHQLDRMFRQSRLMRPKWDEMHGSETYGATTIAKALSKVVKQYPTKARRRRAARQPSPRGCRYCD